jgi:hypothetical protein
METDKEWQQALLKWNPNCLPKYGADGKWGNESKSALCLFQRSNRLDCTGYQDNFSHLKLYHVLYPNGKPIKLGLEMDKDYPRTVSPQAEHITLPKDILLAAATLAADPPMFCDKCGGDLVEGRCPDCAVPTPTAPNPKAKKKG